GDGRALERAVAEQRLHGGDAKPALPRRPAEAVARDRRRLERDHGARPRHGPRAVRQRRQALAPSGPHADRPHDHAPPGLGLPPPPPSSTSAALHPPNPSDVLRLTRGRTRCGSAETPASPHSGSGSPNPDVGGTTPYREARRHVMASSVAAAPIV